MIQGALMSIKLWKRRLLKKTLAKESALVAEDSMEVLEAFEQIEDEIF